jgi:hypothetical protein
MKKLISLMAVPLIASVTSCVPKEPVKEDYFKGYAPIDIGSYLNASVKDFDNDGLADAIISTEGNLIFYVKGYEKMAHLDKNSIEMTPELRKDASDFIKADNILRYHAAKAEYERIKVSQDTAEVKK